VRWQRGKSNGKKENNGREIAMVKGKEPWREKENSGRGEKVAAYEKEKIQGEGAMAQGRERAQGEGVTTKGRK